MKTKELNKIKDQNRRQILKALGAVSAMTLYPRAIAHAAESKTSASHINAGYFYVGSYSAPNYAPGSKMPSTAKGISVFKVDKNGEIKLVQEVEADNPSFIAINSDKTNLYCVNELGNDANGQPLGRISAYRIDASTGQLTLLNSQLTQGTWPCHCSVHPNGKYALAANYGSGSFVAYPLNSDGSIGKMSGLYQSEANGLGPDGARQEGPHAHMITSNKGGDWVFGIDLGSDKVTTLKLDPSSGKLELSIVPFANVSSGAGPRQMDFHPNDKYAYVLNELSSTIDIFRFENTRGAFTLIHSVSTLPVDTRFTRPSFDPTNPGFVPEGTNTTAAIKVHPSGKWLYATNRGMNSIATYAIDQCTGKLLATNWTDTQGQIPRGMDIEPTGNALFVGNQDSDNVLIFGIDHTNGQLTGPIHTINTPVPVDFAFNLMS